MVEGRAESLDVKDKIFQLDEHLCGLLAAENYRGGELTQTYNDFETAIHEATKLGIKSMESGFLVLATHGEEARAWAEANGDEEAKTYFMTKSTTYRQVLETVSSKTSARPTISDTQRLPMSGRKSRI